MGVTWRRINERVLQMGPSFSARRFLATSNGRNEAMFEEATEFAKSIVTLQRDVKLVLKHVEVHFVNLRGILSSPIPRIYDAGPDGPLPVDNDCQLLGQGMDVDAIPRAVDEARAQVDTEVMDPLMEWMEAYNVLTERMKSLESIRLELDSRRRTVSGIQSRYERIKATLTTNHKTMAEARHLEDTLAHKEAKMARALSQFQELERTVYNSLYTLVRDTSVLRDYTHSVLVIVQGCFEQAAAAYSCAAAPSGSDVPHKYKQSNGKATKKLGGILGKLIGKRDPDTAHRKDQAAPSSPYLDTTPLALPAPPQQLLLTQGAPCDIQYQQQHHRAQWQQHNHDQPSVPPMPLAPSATSATYSGNSGYSGHTLPVATMAKQHPPPSHHCRGLDQQLTGGGGYHNAGNDLVQDVGHEHLVQPYAELPVYEKPNLEMQPGGAWESPQPSPPPCPAVPTAPMYHHTAAAYSSQYRRPSSESGWNAEGY